MNKRCIIIGASNFDIEIFKNFINKIEKNDYVVCLDGGLNSLKNTSIKFDIWIGDGDSLLENVNYEKPTKNETDNITIKKIIEHSGRKFYKIDEFNINNNVFKNFCDIKNFYPNKSVSKIIYMYDEKKFETIKHKFFKKSKHFNINIKNIATLGVLLNKKDDTDLMFAINYALQLGFENFEIFGCTGKRFDHYFSNISLLEVILENNGFGRIYDKNNIIMIQNSGIKTYKKNKNYKYISILSLENIATKVTTKGLKYSLNNTKLYRTNPIGTSNEFIEEFATIKIKSGKILVIYSR